MLSEEMYRILRDTRILRGLDSHSGMKRFNSSPERRGRFFVATALVFRLSIGSTSSPDRKHPATPVTMRLLLSSRSKQRGSSRRRAHHARELAPVKRSGSSLHSSQSRRSSHTYVCACRCRSPARDLSFSTSSRLISVQPRRSASQLSLGFQKDSSIAPKAIKRSGRLTSC